MKANCVVLDSGPIIKGAALETLGKHAITVPGVVKEIKDIKTRERLRNLPPYFLAIRSPCEQAIKHVIRISKETGDVKVISKVDIEVAALSYELEFLKTAEEVENMFEKIILDSDFENEKISEEKRINSPNESNLSNITNSECGDEYFSDVSESDDDNSDDIVEDLINNQESKTIEEIIENMKITEEDTEETIYTCNEVDDDGWITEENFEQMKSNNFGLTLDSEQIALDKLSEIPKIACLTTDYAIQNLLLHMKIPILSVGGMVIKEPRIFISRCRSCFKQFKKVDIYFCPHCGNDNLGKIPAKIHENGEVEIFLKKNFQPNLRHTKFSIPTPKGGKHLDGNSYIYCADQRLPQERLKKQKSTIDLYENDSFFNPYNITAKSSVLGINNVRNGPLRPTRPRGNQKSKFRK